MKVMVAVVLLFSVCSVQSAEVIRLDGISIQGNSEEPNVLYVTPWQPAPGAGQLFVPIKSYRKHWIKPISKKSMQREVRYLNHFQENGSYAPIGYETK